jgi:hypothetical protein
MSEQLIEGCIVCENHASHVVSVNTARSRDWEIGPVVEGTAKWFVFHREQLRAWTCDEHLDQVTAAYFAEYGTAGSERV